MARLQLAPDEATALALQAVHDRLIGCLFGSALGDAIGLYTEFLTADMAASSYPSRFFTLLPRSRATEFRTDAHRDPHQPGEWTDDTDHALLILLSFLHTDGADCNPQDFASRLHIWVRQGLRALDTLPMGLGRTVGSIVRNKTYLDDPEGTARQHWVNCGFNAAPNGSLMRTHPLGLVSLDKTLDETFQLAADFSVLTHVDPRCVVSCAIGTALVRGLLRHEVKAEEHIDQVVDQAIAWYSAYRERQMSQNANRKDEPELDVDELRRHAKVEDLAHLKLDEMGKIGYVYKTLGSGIHLLRMAMRKASAASSSLTWQVSIFEPLIVDLIMRGGDADTNACFAGALVGALVGFKALPSHWRDGLKHGAWLMDKAEGLSRLLGVADGRYSGSEDPDTAPDGGRGFLTDRQMEEKVMLLQIRMTQEGQRRREREARGKSKGRGWFGSWR
ncbi:ADP-ribosylglycohydrolase [Hirsutella rhossiliensis]|uniref:ADP-ribosylglycohydrolase domain-containing protein n=1 Tax=Hirsutella rhossiliensis TaxID=111463 RepID=A0A9P8MXJ2_9HYPO|nr:ADP-ribosylglycohydrolase domain-containing protein [Hirsutella rhossiliensis]KAH0962827.1 ADP-ribosylglycohydrolase domain-containing protein [Hirsutella rhossiliensis]